MSLASAERRAQYLREVQRAEVEVLPISGKSPKPNPFRPRLAQLLISEACLRWDITERAFLSGALHKPCVLARREVCVALRSYGWALARIGYAVNLHHTTVLHHIRVHQKELREKNVPAEIPEMDLSGEWAI